MISRNQRDFLGSIAANRFPKAGNRLFSTSMNTLPHSFFSQILSTIIPRAFLLAAIFIASPHPASADVKLPAIISDHMVLQKAGKVPIWGKAEPGEEVTVTLDGKTAKATAGTDGR